MKAGGWHSIPQKMTGYKWALGQFQLWVGFVWFLILVLKARMGDGFLLIPSHLCSCVCSSAVSELCVATSGDWPLFSAPSCC